MSVIACLQHFEFSAPRRELGDGRRMGQSTLLQQLRVLRFGFLQDGDVGFLALGQFHFKRIYLVATYIADEESRTVGS
jgi:hypothetical protein